MEIFRRPIDPEAAEFADLLDVVLAPGGAQRPPQASAGMQSLLQVATATRDALQVGPARPARDEARRAMLNHAAAKVSGAGPFQVPGFATAGAVSAAVMLASLFGTVNAAEAALPGDFLYPLKGALEETLIALTPSEAARLQLKIDFANRRTGELEALNEQEREVTVDVLERAAGQLQDIAVAAKALPADAPQLRQVASAARKSLEVLTQVSDRVPEQARPALEHAISASQDAQAAAPPPKPASAPAAPGPVVRQEPVRAAGSPAAASPTATPVTLLPSRSGPGRSAAERNSGNNGSNSRNDDDGARGRPAPTATSPADTRSNGRGGRDDDDDVRGEPAQDRGRGGSNPPGLPGRPPAAPTVPAAGGSSPTAVLPPSQAPSAGPTGGSASVEPRRTRPGDDDDDRRPAPTPRPRNDDEDDRRPAPSPTPRPRSDDDDRSGPGRGGRSDGAPPAPTVAPPRPAPSQPTPVPALPTPAPVQPTAVPASPTVGSGSGPNRNQRDGEGTSNRNQGNDDRNDDRGRDNRGRDDDSRNRSPQAPPPPEPTRGGGSGPQRGRN